MIIKCAAKEAQLTMATAFTGWWYSHMWQALVRDRKKEIGSEGKCMLKGWFGIVVKKNKLIKNKNEGFDGMVTCKIQVLW